MRVSISPSSSPSIRRPRSKVKQNPAVLKTIHDKKERKLVDGRVAHEEQVAELTN